MTYTGVGTFTGLYGLMAMLVSLPAGLAIKRSGDKRVLAAGLVLAALGAKAIKIEDPESGDLSRANSPYLGPLGFSGEKHSEDDISICYLTRSRGKYGISLKL